MSESGRFTDVLYLFNCVVKKLGRRYGIEEEKVNNKTKEKDKYEFKSIEKNKSKSLKERKINCRER